MDQNNQFDIETKEKMNLDWCLFLSIEILFSSSICSTIESDSSQEEKLVSSSFIHNITKQNKIEYKPLFITISQQNPLV